MAAKVDSVVEAALKKFKKLEKAYPYSMDSVLTPEQEKEQGVEDVTDKYANEGFIVGVGSHRTNAKPNDK